MDISKVKNIPIHRTTLTVAEVAQYIGISKELIYKKVREKEIPHLRLGARILFKKESIDRFLLEMEEGGIQ